MPGICGIIECAGHIDELDLTLAAMLEALTSEPWHAAQSRVDRVALSGFGVVALDGTRRLQVAWDAGTRCGLVLDGELLESAHLAAKLQREGVELSADDHAGLLLAGLRRTGPAFLRGVQGSFAAALWDGARRELTLVTDHFGSRPLYYRESADGLRFSSGLASLLVRDFARRQVNPRGLAQFFTFGHYLRDDAALKDVHLLPAAACWTYRATEHRMEPTAYWSLNESPTNLPNCRSEWLERIEATFVTAVRRCTSDTPQLGLSLSGGMDARSLLGVIDVKQTPLQAICMGVMGSLDHRSSRELSRLAGCPYHAHVLDATFLSNFRSHLERMVQLTDGQYLSQCIVVPTLPVYRDLGIRTLLRGHAGELMHMRKAYNYSLDDAALQIRTSGQLRDWMFRHLPAFLLDGVTGPLFAPEYQSGLSELAGESLNKDLQDAAEIEQPLQRIWRIFVTQRLRRETPLSMLKFRTIVEPRLPFLDPDLVSLLLSAPTDLKLGEEIQTHILRKHRPEFLRVPNANTGARVGASPWSQKVATLRMKVLAKLRVPGYQPYEKLGLWLRQELAPIVRDILLDPQTLDRGVFQPEGIRAVVKAHQEQGRNHTYLLMALMIFELGLRRLMDGESGSRDLVPMSGGALS